MSTNKFQAILMRHLDNGVFKGGFWPYFGRAVLQAQCSPCMGFSS